MRKFNVIIKTFKNPILEAVIVLLLSWRWAFIITEATHVTFTQGLFSIFGFLKVTLIIIVRTILKIRGNFYSSISSLTSSFTGLVWSELRAGLHHIFSGLGRVVSISDSAATSLAPCSAARCLTAGSAALLSFRRSWLGLTLLGDLVLACTLLCLSKDSYKITFSFPFAVVTVSFAVLPAFKLLSKAHRAFLAFSTPAISDWNI